MLFTTSIYFRFTTFQISNCIIYIVITESLYSRLPSFTYLIALIQIWMSRHFFFLRNLLLGGEPSGKPTDKGGNAWIKEIRDNGVKVGFTIDNKMRTISPQWILYSAQLGTYAQQQNYHGHPCPSLLLVYYAINQREYNVNKESRETQQMIQPVIGITRFDT
jgi:hypothetical protein